MSKRKQIPTGIVYSTDPGFTPEFENDDETETLPPPVQKLRIRLETKHRAGKSVTLIEGFIGKESDKDELVKKLKNFCGTGGSSKEGELLIQGDQREKIFQWLIKQKYIQTKRV